MFLFFVDCFVEERHCVSISPFSLLLINTVIFVLTSPKTQEKYIQDELFPVFVAMVVYTLKYLFQLKLP